MKTLSLFLFILLLDLATPPGLHAQVFTDLYDFSAGTGTFDDSGVVNADGARPLGGLVIAGGALYGTCAYGGSLGAGVVFKLDFNGGNFSTIHAFDANSYVDGYNPNVGLISANGLLYGTTFGRTRNGNGFIFSVIPDGSTQTPAFNDNHGDSYIAGAAGLTASAGHLYGITTYGGLSEYSGSIFKINTDQTGLTNIYSFTDTTGVNSVNNDGAHPRGTMVLADDTLYGTAELGGAKGLGTVFSIKTNGTAFKVLHTFLGGSSDGGLPTVNLAVSGNTLYGTTQSGGTGGTVFKINTDGSGYKVIHFFNGATGAGSKGGVIAAGNTLYGMAETGGTGANNSGALFSLNLDGTGYRIVSYVPSNLNGGFYNGLIQSGSTLYGTSRLGGVGSIAGSAGTNDGFVFSITLPAETIRPVLNITNVAAGMQVSNANYIVKGTATDNVAVAGVHCQLNGTGWVSPTSFIGNNWSDSVTLNPGTNQFQAFAVDTSGNNSPTSNVSLFFSVTNQLQISMTGLGKIAPNYSNAWLQIGRNYSITASPASGFVFTNWIVSTNWLAGTAVSKTNLQFMMASNLTLQANFLDVKKPTITITAPATGQHMTNALATVVGTTMENWKVAGVWYSLNSSAWNLVNTTNRYTNWAQTVTLLLGTNTVKAYAMDLGGNFSTTNSLSIISSNTFMLQLAFTNALPLETNGLVFSLQLSKGLNGHIQVSSNLINWVTLTNFVGTNSTLMFRDAAATNSIRRFYRAVTQ